MIRAAISLCVLGALAGCMRPGDTSALLALKAGISPGELQARLQARGRHQVTAAVDGGEVLCVSYSFVEEWDQLYFVFRDDALEKIIEPPAFSYVTRIKDGERVSERLPIDPERRLTAVLESPALSQTQIAGLVDKWYLNQHRRQEQEDCGVLPAVIIVSPLILVLSPVYVPLVVVLCAHDECVARHFNPRKIQVGMSTEKVDGVFGAPRYVTATGSEMVRVYGVPGKPAADEDLPFAWVSVVLQNDHVVRVRSNDFFDERLICP